MKEKLTSRRIRDINLQTGDIHSFVADLNGSLVDRESLESLNLIDEIRTRLNLLKEQIVNGDII